MGALKYNKCQKIDLRLAGFDEKWLQDKIVEDPSILGLGDLFLIDRERSQPKDRLDLLLSDSESDIRFVTEIQLGALDENHIIRTIEYWDIERKRFPHKKHMAVIVAEDVTTRFLNILSLLNSTVPLIVLQLNCNTFEGNVFLSFVEVLKHVEHMDMYDEELISEKTDRNFWIKRFSIERIEAVDKIIDIFKKHDENIIPTYNKCSIAFGSFDRKKNYAWFHLRKTLNHVILRMRFVDEDYEKIQNNSEEFGSIVSFLDRNRIKFIINFKDIKENIEMLEELSGMARKTIL